MLVQIPWKKRRLHWMCTLGLRKVTLYLGNARLILYNESWMLLSTSKMININRYGSVTHIIDISNNLFINTAISVSRNYSELMMNRWISIYCISSIQYMLKLTGNLDRQVEQCIKDCTLLWVNTLLQMSITFPALKDSIKKVLVNHYNVCTAKFL